MEYRELEPRICHADSDSENEEGSGSGRVGASFKFRRFEIDIPDEGLPIMKASNSILRAIEWNRVTVLVASTGSGKSSIVPSLLYERSKEECMKIVITQPRRVAAIRLSERVASFIRRPEDRAMGRLVGYGIRGDQRFAHSETRIIYQTTGYLQKLLAYYPTLVAGYTHILLDEVHERSIDSDFLCLIIKTLLAHSQHSHVRVVIMSATMQAALYRNYFMPINGGLLPHQIVLDTGSQHTVKTYHLEDIASMVPDGCHATHKAALAQFVVDANTSVSGVRAEFSEYVRDLCVQLILKFATDGNAVLCFLPGHGEMTHVTEVLEGELIRRGETVASVNDDLEEYTHFCKNATRHFYEIHSLHGLMPQSQMQHPLASPPKKARRIILATNVAESSLTVARVNVVIDTGLRKISRYDYEGSFSRLINTWCSRASITQRQGRTGRVCDGVSIRLFTKEWETRVLNDYDVPDASFENFSSVLLFAKQLCESWHRSAILTSPKPSDMLAQLLDPPDARNLEAAIEGLAAAGLTRGEPSEMAPLTLMGILATRMQIDTSVCRLIYYSWIMGIPIEGIVLAAACSMERDVLRYPTRFSQGMEEKFARDSRNSLVWRELFDAGSLSEPIQFRNVMLAWVSARTGIEVDANVVQLPAFDPAAVFSAEFEAFRCLCESIAERFESFLIEDLGVQPHEDIATFRFILNHFSARSGDPHADAWAVHDIGQSMFSRVPFLMPASITQLKLLLSIAMNRRVFHANAVAISRDQSGAMTYKIASTSDEREISRTTLVQKEKAFFKLASSLIGEKPQSVRFSGRGDELRVTPFTQTMQLNPFLATDQVRIALQFFERKRIQFRLQDGDMSKRRYEQEDFIYVYRPRVTNLVNWYYLSTCTDDDGELKRSVLPVRFSLRNPVGWMMQGYDKTAPTDYWAVSSSIQGLSSAPDVNGLSWLTDTRADFTTVLPLEFGGSLALVYQLLSLPFRQGLEAVVAINAKDGDYQVQRVHIEGKWFHVHPMFPITSAILLAAAKIRTLIAAGTNIGCDDTGDITDAMRQLEFVRNLLPNAVSSLFAMFNEEYARGAGASSSTWGSPPESHVWLIEAGTSARLRTDPAEWTEVDNGKVANLSIQVQSVHDLKPLEETILSRRIQEVQRSRDSLGMPAPVGGSTSLASCLMEPVDTSAVSTAPSKTEWSAGSVEYFHKQRGESEIETLRTRMAVLGFSESEIDGFQGLSPVPHVAEDPVISTSGPEDGMFHDVWMLALAKQTLTRK